MKKSKCVKCGGIGKMEKKYGILGVEKILKEQGTWEIEKIGRADKKLEKGLSTLFTITPAFVNSLEGDPIKSLPTKGHKIKMGSRKSNINPTKSNKFFKKAGKAVKKVKLCTKLSRKEAVQEVTSKQDNLSKKIKEMVIIDNSLVESYVPDICHGVVNCLKNISKAPNFIKEINDKTSGLGDCLIKSVNTKNLSKRQRTELETLRAYVESISVGKTDILDIIETHANRYVSSELHKYFQEERGRASQYYPLEDVVEKDAKNSPEDFSKFPAMKKYKYIAEEMNRIFLDSLKGSMEFKELKEKYEKIN